MRTRTAIFHHRHVKLALGVLVAIAAMGSATPAAAQTPMALYARLLSPISVNPYPVLLGNPITVSCTVGATFDEDYNETSFGDWVTKSGTLNGKKYNRTRTKTVVAWVFSPGSKKMEVRPAGVLEATLWFDGAGPHQYSGTFVPAQGVGVWTMGMLIVATEQSTATPTTYIEYWYKQGTQWIYVGTSGGTVGSATLRTHWSNLSPYPPFTFEVVGESGPVMGAQLNARRARP